MPNNSHKPYIVGIAGGSASGKTSFLRDLGDGLPPGSISIVTQDNYYVAREEQKKDRNGEYNFDLPTSIDRTAFHRDLCALIAGKSIALEEYTFNNDSAVSDTVKVHPAPIIIMEGLFIFYYDEIRELLDLRVYLDVREEIKLERRILRDAMERGYNEQTVRYQWENHVMPSYKQFLRPFRDTSDLIITNNTSYDKGLEVLTNHLRAKVGAGVVGAVS